MRRRRGPSYGHAFLGFAVVFAAAIGFIASSAYTASNTVPSTNVGQYVAAIGAAELKPAACTGTVTSIRNATGTVSVATANTLILGSSGNDNVTASSGYNCFVGGAGSNDKFTGPNVGGDECIVGTAVPSANIKKCTIVLRSP